MRITGEKEPYLAFLRELCCEIMVLHGRSPFPYRKLLTLQLNFLIFS
jgi:hypothetical protein